MLYCEALRCARPDQLTSSSLLGRCAKDIVLRMSDCGLHTDMSHSMRSAQFLAVMVIEDVMALPHVLL